MPEKRRGQEGGGGREEHTFTCIPIFFVNLKLFLSPQILFFAIWGLAKMIGSQRVKHKNIKRS